MASIAAANVVKTPNRAQDVQVVAALVRQLEDAARSKRKAGFSVRKARFTIENSPDGIRVDSWRMQDWDYKRRDLPVYARGLFTARNRRNEPEIVVRGYDKFFNVNEVHETRWENILSRTQGPYELTLKENGCIIFISGLEDDTLLVCSKHSTGFRNDIEVSHAHAGEKRLEAQLERLGKTKADLARELRTRNVTAVAELCDDSFEEHILAYPPDKAGLYLHGINLNLPEFMTYPSPLVQQFAEQWGFVKTDLILMEDIENVKTFLEEVAETGAHDGRDVEGFVIRCKMSPKPDSMPFQDWFFKFKFEEPYLMYRQWRECTKSMISGKQPRYKKHQLITEEYLLFARKRLAADPKLAKLYNQNHGIIQLRNDFLAFKNLKGSDAAAVENAEGNGDVRTEVTKDVILAPIATIGCGKTTIALALVNLFGFGHVQNDNITGTKRPPRFTKMVLDQLQDHPAVIADRNNAQKHERKQIIGDVKMAHTSARLIALNFVHDDMARIREITQDRVLARGDNHQTIHAASDQSKVIGIMDGFLNRFEPCDLTRFPDQGFDAVIDLDPTVGSRANLETVVTELHRLYPNLIPVVPSPEEMDAAIQSALDEYSPELRHTLPSRGQNGRAGPSQQPAKKEKKKPLEYMSVDVPTKELNAVLEETFKSAGPEDARFYRLLFHSRRVQLKFHVTLMHKALAKQHPALWERYVSESEAAAATSGDGKVGDCNVQLERIVFDDRVMAIVVRLVDSSNRWVCVNKVAHITVGTRDEKVKPKESNDLLAKWLEEGATESNRIVDVNIETRPTLQGTVKGVLSR
jgi:tRNA ligase